MKNALLLIALTLPITIFAQNWQPVNPDYIYYFKSDTAELIDNTVKVDSVSNEAGYPVYFLNTVISYCDTCQGSTTFSCYFVDADEFYFARYPNFLQKEVHLLNAGHIWFRDTGSYVIIPDASTNQSWLYDTLNAVTAWVSQVSSAEILPGVIDSVKTIALSDGDEIILAKHHGIIKYPLKDSIIQYYQLVGLHTGTARIGNTPPTFEDYFNFSVGDVFQYWA
nr:hypothetical protein [Bacteroidota bacterium]